MKYGENVVRLIVNSDDVDKNSSPSSLYCSRQGKALASMTDFMQLLSALLV